MKRADLPSGFDFDAFDRACAGLEGGLRPIFAATRRLQAELLGLDGEVSPVGGGARQRIYAQPGRNRIRAELLTDGASLYLAEIAPGSLTQPPQVVEGRVQGRRSYVLNLYSMSAEPRDSGLDAVASALGTALGVKMSSWRYQNERFGELRGEGRETAHAPAKEELAAARVLRDRAVRTAAIAIKASAGLLVSDLPRQLGDAKDRSEDVRQQLLGAGLVQNEYVVMCRKSSGQVARFPSLETIKEVSAQGVKCACGRAMKDERCEEALSTTQFAANLLEHSRWFSLILVDELVQLGIPLSDVMTDVQAGGDEMDCLAVISGDLVLFELKDKEFNLGNAYSFGAKIGLLNPARSVIVTTESVGNDAKEHFQRAEEGQKRARRGYVDDESPTGSAPVEYFEGLEQLRPKLQALVSDICEADAARLLGTATSFATPSPSALLGAVRARPARQETPSKSDAPETNGTGAVALRRGKGVRK